jgi:hypothetical protein
VQVTQEQIDDVEAKCRVDEDVIRGIMARVPPSWDLIQHLPAGGAFRRGNLQVLFTVQKYENCFTHAWETWVHASVCGRRGEHRWYLPDWEEVKRVKHDFIGEDRWAYQVFPSSKDYVNQHAYVLHLYALLDGEPALPDFTWGLGTI